MDELSLTPDLGTDLSGFDNLFSSPSSGVSSTPASSPAASTGDIWGSISQGIQSIGAAAAGIINAYRGTTTPATTPGTGSITTSTPGAYSSYYTQPNQGGISLTMIAVAGGALFLGVLITKAMAK